MLKKPLFEGLAAIQLSPEGIALVRAVQRADGAVRVTDCDFRPVSDAADVPVVLARLAADRNLKRTRCTTLLGTGDYTLIQTETPPVPHEELRAAVRWRIKDLIDFRVDDATLDVFDLPAGTAAGRTRSINVVAARNGAVQRLADLCGAAGINLDVIDIPELAQRNLAGLCPEDKDGLVLLSFQTDHGLITVTRQGELYMSRRFDLGAEALRRAPGPTPYFEQIALEVHRSLDYFDSHFRQAPIRHLIVASPIPLPGLVDFLNANLNLRAAELHLAERLGCDPAQARLLEERCLMALGAALREAATAASRPRGPRLDPIGEEE